MATIPQELLDRLEAAESALSEAKARDGDQARAEEAMNMAESRANTARDEALAAHQGANARAAEALAAVRAHFGLE